MASAPEPIEVQESPEPTSARVRYVHETVSAIQTYLTLAQESVTAAADMIQDFCANARADLLPSTPGDTPAPTFPTAVTGKTSPKRSSPSPPPADT